jgi:hypothetical protein
MARKPAAKKPPVDDQVKAAEPEAEADAEIETTTSAPPAEPAPDTRAPWAERLAGMTIAEIELLLASGRLGERKTAEARARLTALRQD